MESLLDTSLEDLFQLEVRAASRMRSDWLESPGAVTVLGRDDLLRGGEIHLPEVLRHVPGIQVARLNSHRWSMTSRFFNEGVPKTLGLQVDGMMENSPNNYRINWDTLPVFLDDVASVEVLRGPSMSAWGAFSGNGLLRVTSLPASETQGGQLVGHISSDAERMASVRYGGRLGSDVFYRLRMTGLYAPSLDETFQDEPAFDGTGLKRGEARIDWAPESNDSIATLHYSGYEGTIHETLVQPVLRPPFTGTVQDVGAISGNRVQMRWQQETLRDQQIDLQMGYDHVDRDSRELSLHRDSFQANASFEQPLGVVDSVFGIQYARHDEMSEEEDPLFYLRPDRIYETTTLISQFRIPLLPDVSLELGGALEHNSFTGWEALPSARLAWLLAPNQTVWMAASRTVRTPTRIERDLRYRVAAIPGEDGSLTSIEFVGQDGYDSEEAAVYELGWRGTFGDMKLDVAAFYNEYDKLQSFERQALEPQLDPVPHLRLPLLASNEQQGEVFGLEVDVRYNLGEDVMLRLATSLQDVRLDGGGEIQDEDQDESPHYIVSIGADWDLSQDLSLHGDVQVVDRLQATEIDGYERLDLHGRWQASPSLDVRLGARRLLSSGYAEFGDKSTGGLQPGIFEPSVYLETRYAF